MTEAEWLGCGSDELMWQFLRTAGKMTRRKETLCGTASYRLLWQLLTDERCRHSIEVSELFVEGLATQGDVDRAQWAAAEPEPWFAAWGHTQNSDACRCNLIREIFGPLPFDSIPVDPTWLAWNNGAVRKLAESAYADRDLPSGTLDQVKLAVLADALEEAGCVNADMLSHLRDPDAVHVRGCWVIDLLLNRA